MRLLYKIVVMHFIFGDLVKVARNVTKITLLIFFQNKVAR